MMRWLIASPAGLCLHVFHDDTFAWSSDATRALRFKTKGDAERFGRDRLTVDFVAVAHPAGELVQPQAEPMTGEVEDLVDF